MSTLKLEAVRSDTNEQLDCIDLREPITAEKIIRYKQVLQERIASRLGAEALPGLVRIHTASDELPPTDAFVEIPEQATARHLYIAVNND